MAGDEIADVEMAETWLTEPPPASEDRRWRTRLETALHAHWPRLARASTLVFATGIAATADSWRYALLALVAGAAVAATRIRFAGFAALCLLLAAAVLALNGRAGTRDARQARDSPSAQQEDRPIGRTQPGRGRSMDAPRGARRNRGRP